MQTTINLEQIVRNAVENFLDSREAFTTADISHPIIRDDNSIRHKDVKELIDKMYASNEMEEAAFTVTPITVWPQGGNKPINGVRLFHPDEPGFDVSSYTRNKQTLVRDNTMTRAANDFATGNGTVRASDTRPDYNSDVIANPSNTSNGDQVLKTCHAPVQCSRYCLNIPKTISDSAGFHAGDAFVVLCGVNDMVIQKNTNGDQTVDSEGRIRIYSGALSRIGKNYNDSCLIMEVKDQFGNVFIQVQ